MTMEAFFRVRSHEKGPFSLRPVAESAGRDEA